MITLNDISILIVSRVNDPKRISAVYNRIRKFYPENEIVVVYDSNDFNLGVNDPNLKEINTKERVYVSGGYNLALKSCSKKCFVFLHDDTFIHRDFLKNLLPHIQKDKITNFTTVEPPLFNNSDLFGRPIQNFGFDLEDLDLDSFDRFCDDRNYEKEGQVIDSQTGGFFMSGYVSTLLEMGGFDEKFKPFFFEDSDLMFRLHLSGIKFVQVLNSLVYHLGSLTSRKSEDGNYAIRETEKIFLKKWKVPFHILQNYSMINGLKYKRVRVRLEYKNLDNVDLINHISLFFDEDMQLPHSTLYIDGNTFTKNDLEYIYTLPYTISQNNWQNGKYQLNNMILDIDTESIYEPDLIENNL